MNTYIKVNLEDANLYSNEDSSRRSKTLTGEFFISPDRNTESKRTEVFDKKSLDDCLGWIDCSASSCQVVEEIISEDREIEGLVEQEEEEKVYESPEVTITEKSYSIKPGDRIRIKKDVRYFISGERISSWLLYVTWYVLDVKDSVVTICLEPCQEYPQEQLKINEVYKS